MAVDHRRHLCGPKGVVSFLGDLMPRLTLILLFATLCGCGGWQTRAGKMTVNLATTRGSLLFFPVHLAKSLGYYQQEGIDLAIEEVASAPKSMQALLGGSTDIVAGGFMSVVSMHAEGRPVQAFLLLVRDPGYVALVSPRASRPVRQIEDLRGATIGVSSSGSDQHQILNYIMSRHGLRAEDAKVVAVGAGMSHTMALERGTIDIGMAYGTTVSQVQKRQPNISILFDLRSPEDRRKHLGVGEIAHSVLFTKADWIQKHPDTVTRIARATLRAVNWSFSHTPEEVRTRLPESMRTDDAAVDTDAIKSVAATLAPDGAFRPEHIESTLAILSISNPRIRESASKLAGAYTNQFLAPLNP
jgi:NitT/TauT family transport system substrate-binding protein